MAPQLSVNDARVLSVLFDPESSPSTAVKVDTDKASLPNLSDDETARLQAEHTSILSPLSASAATEAQIKSTTTALDAFIAAHPTYGPAYVDRAQLTRLSLATSDLFTEKTCAASATLLPDLQRAIDLMTPASPTAALSALQSRSLAAAHTHRGLLLLRIADLLSRDLPTLGAPAHLSSLSAEAVEELASHSFSAGGRYGNTLARGLAVRTNPYAKMCGAIVREAMRDEQASFVVG